MSEQTFTIWLLERYNTARKALIRALEYRDHMYYVEASQLRQEYMEKIGVKEEVMLEVELDVFLLDRKKDLIQKALNQGQKPDLDAIDKLLEEEKNKKISEMEEADKTLEELPELTEEEKTEMQRLYHDIVEKFHPQANPQINDVQRELYGHALEAYIKQNVKELEVVHGMLFDEYEFERELKKAIETYKALKEAQLLEVKNEDRQNDSEHVKQNIGTSLLSDFTLAANLFDAFRKDENDLVIQKYTEEILQQVRDIKRECDELKTQFPFNAKETLASKEMTKQYLEKVTLRQYYAETSRKKLKEKIESLITGE